MLRYVAKRLMMAVFILWAVATIAFALTFLSGDPATLMIGDHWTAEQIDSFREQMGYDRPLLVQYGDYLAGIPRGDFGISVRQQVPVIDLIVQRFPATLELTAAALFLILFISIPLGVLSAVKRNTPADRVAMSGALFAQSVPTFWLGIMLILVFGGLAALVTRLGKRLFCAPYVAGYHTSYLFDRPYCSPRSLLHAGRAGTRLYPDGPCKGTTRVANQLCACPEKRPDSCYHHVGN